MLQRIAGLALVASILSFAQTSANNPAAAAPEAPPIPSCPAGAPLGAVDLRVLSPQNADRLPFRNINHLSEGDTLLYAPVLRGREKRPGEIALVVVPLKRDPDKPILVVTDPRSAHRSRSRCRIPH